MPAAAAPGVGGAQRNVPLPPFSGHLGSALAGAINRAAGGVAKATGASPKPAPPPKSYGASLGRAISSAASHVGAVGREPSRTPQQNRFTQGLAKQQAQGIAGQQKVAKLVAAANKPSKSKGGLLAAIEGLPLASIAEHAAAPLSPIAAALTPELGKLLSNAGKDALNLPGSTLTGAEGLGTSLLDDITHGRLGVLNYGPMAPGGGSHTGKLVSEAVSQDPIVHGITTGDFSGIVKHPLYAGMDALGAYGALGRTAGALARSGALGRDLADAASTARTSREIVPGLPGDVQHYSKNLMTKKVQQAIEKRPALDATIRDLKSPTFDNQGTRLHFDHQAKSMRKSADEQAATHAAREAAASHTVAEALNAAKPASKTAAAVVPQTVMRIAGAPDQFLHELEHTILPKLQEAHAQGKLSPAARKANEAQQANIEAFLHNPDLQAAHVSATDYITRQNELDRKLAERQLLDSAQAERRTVEPYAQAQIPGAKIIPKDAIPTQAALDAQRARQELVGLKRNLIAVGKDHAVRIKTHGDAERAVEKSRVELERLRSKEASARSFIIGRHGAESLAPAEGALTQSGVRFRSLADALGAERGLPKSAAVRLDRHMSVVDEAAQVQHTLKAALEQERINRRAQGLSEIAAAKDTLKDAREHFAAVHKPYLKQKFGGLVVHDPAAPVITKGRFKGEQLRPLTTKEVTDHMAAAGVDPAGYIKLNSPADKSGLFTRFSRTGGRGGSKGKAYSGSGLLSGAWNPGYGALAKSQLASVAKLERAITNDHIVHDNSLVKPSGEYFQQHEVAQAAHDLKEQTGHDFVGVAAHPSALPAAAQERIHAMQEPGTAAHMAGTASFQDRLVNEHTPAESIPRGHVVLMPKVMHDRFLQHMDLSAKPARGLGAINRQFRNTVLPFSPKWLMGNVTEAALRSALVGAGPRDASLASKVIDRMRELGMNDQADHLERMATGGLHYGMQQRLNLESIGAHDNVVHGPIRTAARQVSDQYSTRVVQRIFSFNRRLESGFEKGVLGAHMRNQMQEMAGSWLKAATAQHDYIDKLAHGYADPRLAADAGRYVHDTLGQYDRFSPQMKQFVRSVAPFAPWYFNAAKFVYYTLPLKHPLVQASLLDVNRPIEEQWAKDHNVPHDTFGVPTGDLLSAVQTSPGDFLNLGRFTPPGAFTGGPLNYATSMMGPQFSGVIHNVFHQDPFGRDLKGPNDKKVTDGGALAMQALNSLLGDFGGPTNVLSRIVQEHGDTPYNTSKLWDVQLKPNTHHGGAGILGGLQRVLFPFEPTHLKKAATAEPATPGVHGGAGSVHGSAPGAVHGGAGKVYGN